MSLIRRYGRYGPMLALIAASALIISACTDTPAPSSKGNRALGVEAEEVAEAEPPPEVQEGVVPDLLGVSVADSRAAVQEAGLEVGTVDTLGLFGTVSDDMVVCEQTPEPGTEPKGKKAAVDFVADRQCE